ncbi:hypothetical protein ABC255_08655 [Neobacillus sp. 3P2-tot-E-2]|uniref:hypothetical protein n=1 Tax=Neobacillus sp. 3P2-tot-E-2 TaxID=3132212 RepID=UPI0039A3C511
MDSINVGDIVYVRSHRVKGKVIKIKQYDRSVLLEIILSYDPVNFIRTTQLKTFALSDCELYKFDRKKKED